MYFYFDDFLFFYFLSWYSQESTFISAYDNVEDSDDGKGQKEKSTVNTTNLNNNKNDINKNDNKIDNNKNDHNNNDNRSNNKNDDKIVNNKNIIGVANKNNFEKFNKLIDEDDNWDDDEDDKKEDNETITEEELRDLFDQCSVSSKGTGDRADVTYVHIYFR